jgi:GNAT superfamily N-acetyltransferase
MDLLGNRLLGAKGLLTAEHPYHASAEVTHFLARRDGRTVGRVAASVNRRFNEHYGSKIGFFGFFEVEDDGEAAAALLDAARAWLTERGMNAMRGPGEYSNATHERQGVLVEGFEFDPTVELTHNPPYYGALLEGYGLAKVKDYVAYMIDFKGVPRERIARLAAGVRKREHIETRCADMKHFDDEVKLIVRLYNEAWAENWGFLPQTEEEAETLAESLKPIVDPGLVRFAYIDGEPVAVFGAIPDPNWALRPRWKWYGDSDPVRLARLIRMRRHIPRVRLMFFGIRPQWRRLGVDAVLFQELYEYGAARGYRQGEPSLLLEDNEMVIRPSVAMGGHEYKRWRIYEMPLA